MATRPTINLNTTKANKPIVSNQIAQGRANIGKPATTAPGRGPLGSTTAQTPQDLNVTPFGVYGGIFNNYPNDIVQLDVYNAVGQYLETNYRTETYILDNNQVTLNPEIDLAQLGYISGRYELTYRFHRNLLGAGDNHRLRIQEVSSNGLEIRVIPDLATNTDNTDFINFFGSSFFNLPKTITLPNLFLFKDARTFVRVFDYVQDKFTFPSSPYSIIFKLTSPITSDFLIDDSIWLAQQVSDPFRDTITIVPPKLPSRKRQIAGPNWDAVNREVTSTSTRYRDWDDVLSTNTETSANLINRMLSGSGVEGIPLNIDYKKFDNYVFFGSAKERLHNFKYKMELLEAYDSRITELTTGLVGLPSSSVSSSIYFQTNVTDVRTKRAALIGSFDGYEKYLYYQSSSYVSNSFGEFYPTTWPKYNSTQPYINCSYTSSQVESWFEGIESSASFYDQNNFKALARLIPNHVVVDDRNDEFVLLVQMMGHYFDLIFAYIKAMNEVYNRDESILEGFSKDLIEHVAKNLGIDFENGNNLEELWSYVLGTDATGSLAYSSGLTLQDRTKETWKRIINNLPYLLKTKGTERGVRALINCFGIPQTILRIREYGGAEPEFDTKTDLVYERFNYALQVGYGGVGQVSTYGSGYYGTASYGSSDPTELISVPWRPLENGLAPSAIQLRVRMAEDQAKDQSIFEVPDQWIVKAFQSASNSYIGFFLNGNQGWATASVSSSIYEPNFNSITLQRSTATDVTSSNQTYTLIVKKVNYGKVVTTQTASLFIDGSVSGSYNKSFISASNLWIPGSGSFTWSQSSSMNLFTGSIQEFRMWKAPLTFDVLDNHALAPTSYQGRTDEVYTGSTSSFDELGFRLCLGSDNKKIDYSLTSSYLSQHPNQDNLYFFQGTTLKAATFYRLRTPLYSPIVEQHSLEWPDLGGNRSVSNKIRIDTTTRIGNVLFTDNKTERASSDNSPIDSPKLGIFLSPTNEINQDIAEQFGALSIDDYIGDPSYLPLEHYPDLESLQRDYLKKYKAKNNVQNYIRLLQHYDSALFQLVKKFVPYRANTQVGLVIEPDILHRTKLPTKPPTLEDLTLTSSLDLADAVYQFGGDVNPEYEGGLSQEQEFITPVGSQQGVNEYLPTEPGIPMVEDMFDTVEYITIEDGRIPDPLRTAGTLNEYNDTGIADQPSTSGSTIAEVDFGVSGYGRDVRVLGSQYTFITYATSGSGPTRSEPYLISSSRYDYSEALNPVIMTSAASQNSNITRYNYDVDIFGGKAFSDYTVYSNTAVSSTITTYTSSAAIYENRWTSQFGLTIVSLLSGSVSYDPLLQTTNIGYWELRGSGAPTAQGLAFTQTAPSGRPVTASVKLPAFFYDIDDPTTYDYLYKVTISTDESGVGVSNRLELHFGDLDCGLTGSVTPTTTQTDITFITPALGNWLGLRLYTAGANSTSTWIPTLEVECLNYRAPMQDFHLHDSYGMRNARYDGCKLTATDFNVDSPDTVDRGPVVEITLVGGDTGVVVPSNLGNLQVQ